MLFAALLFVMTSRRNLAAGAVSDAVVRDGQVDPQAAVFTVG